jgi:Ca2+-binding RTX toxin-like protein
VGENKNNEIAIGEHCSRVSGGCYAPHLRGIRLKRSPATLPSRDARSAGGRGSEFRHMAIITGTDGNDRYPDSVELKGTNLADQMYGLAGDDELVGFDGDDLLEGGAGADVLWGGYGFDYASYKGATAGVTLYMSSSYGGERGDAQGDVLYEIEGVIGSAYHDLLGGDAGDNVLRGGGGNDALSDGLGNDALYGEVGDDRLEGGAGNDRLDGGIGDDWLAAGTGDDVLEGGAGIDTAAFGSGGFVAGVVADLASGTAQGAYHGSDRLSGIENLEGTLDDDRLAGDKRTNALDGRSGADVLEGRGGADQFVYHYTGESTSAAPDLILDFSHKQGDRIDLSAVDPNELVILDLSAAKIDSQVAGDPAFQFIGQAQFTGAGQVRFFQQGGDTVVEANTDDAAPGAELRIMLDPLVNLQATDFVL